MATDDDASRGAARRLEVPLRIEALRKRLAGRPEADRVLARAMAIEERVEELTARAREAGAQASAGIATEVAVLRLEMSVMVAEALGEGEGGGPSEALRSLDPSMRHHLAALLNVPADDRHHALLEVKAAEYLEQARAFDEVAEQFGFLDSTRLDPHEPRGALVLTYNGSLLQLSAPGVEGNPSARRYVYESIYGNMSIPKRGTLSLTASLRVSDRVRTTVLSTSPVRRLRVATRAEAWDKEREVVRRITHTFSSRAPSIAASAAARADAPARADAAARADAMAPPPASPDPPYRTIWGARAGWFPTVVVPVVEAQRAERATREERTELATLVRRLGDPSKPPMDASEEARLVGLVMFIQQARAESGARTCPLEDLVSFTTERGERCVVERAGEGARETVSAIVLERPGMEPLRLEGVGVGSQRVVIGAPCVILRHNASIAAVLGDVGKVEERPKRG